MGKNKVPPGIPLGIKAGGPFVGKGHTDASASDFTYYSDLSKAAQGDKAATAKLIEDAARGKQ